MRTWSERGDGDAYWFLGTLAIIRVSGESVGGRFALIEFLYPRFASPPVHTHIQDETFILVQGEMTFVIGDERTKITDDGIASVPIGTPHTFRVESETARGLVLSTPAGLERLFREGGVPATSATLPPPGTPEPPPDMLAAAFEATGTINLGPGLGPDD